VDAAARALARTAVSCLSLAGHEGAHPRLGVLDVVPFVALGRTPASHAVAARDAFCTWAGKDLALPCFRYGPLPDGTERTLPEVRRGAFSVIPPDAGPPHPHPTAGAAAVGARPPLVAYNLWLEGVGATGALARSVARALRGPAVRALGFDLAHGVQVSCNLIDPATVGPAEVYDAVAERLEGTGAAIARCELVGLVPTGVLARITPHRWPLLDLSEDRTIEARMEAANLAT
jgi:glutamate formiminotransferase / 5-formyltetrahydrofolate cyclo-ligase